MTFDAVLPIPAIAAAAGLAVALAIVFAARGRRLRPRWLHAPVVALRCVAIGLLAFFSPEAIDAGERAGADAAGLATLPLADSDAVRTGDLVFAVGNPFKVGMTATMGMVSATRRAIGIIGSGGFESFIQTDAAINPGNSGGALVDASGR